MITVFGSFETVGSCTAFYTTNNVPKLDFACSQVADNLAYHDGAGTLPVVNDHVYLNSACTITKSAGTYGQTVYSNGFVGSRIVIDSLGKVTSYFFCGFVPE
mgnify:CR=1 FL=1|tara:strand:- start:848 stop:1153 length:306 start_codon:yes stop_codon:yes gene_type:complete